jgi:glycosyltransferase involved in cell wall biosynthesis
MNSVSVVIPLYNKAPHIGRALESVLSQTIPTAEIIVIDDGSTDGSDKIVQTFADPRIRLVHQENQGASVARNRGIAISTGDLIAFLDADDAWHPRFIEVIQEMRKKFPQAGAYGTAYEITTPDGIRRNPEFNIFPPGQKQGIIPNYLKVAISYPIFISAIVIPKKVLEEIGGFYVGSIDNDVDAWLKISLRYPIAWNAGRLSTYYQDAVNRMMVLCRFTDEPAISRTARQAIGSGLIPTDQIQDLKEYVAHFQLSAVRDSLVAGKKETARKILDFAKGTRKYKKEAWKWHLLILLPCNFGPWFWKMKQIFKKF